MSAFERYWRGRFNDITTSDVTLLVTSELVPELPSRQYHLHRIVLAQCGFFQSMLFSVNNNGRWKEDHASQLTIALPIDADFITYDVVDLFFEMIYFGDSDIDEMRDRVVLHAFAFHHLCTRMGFDRGQILSEGMVTECIDQSSVMHTLAYCARFSLYSGPIFAGAMQWVKVFLFTIILCTEEQVAMLDDRVIQTIAEARDAVYSEESKKQLVAMYKRRRPDSTYVRSVPRWSDNNDNDDDNVVTGHQHQHQHQHHKHRLSFLFTHPKDWDLPEDSSQIYKTDNERLLRLPMEMNLVMCKCRWGIELVHDRRANDTFISIHTECQQNKDTGKTACCDLDTGSSLSLHTQIQTWVDVVVHVLHRTRTDTTRHRGNIRSGHIPLDLRHCIPREALEDPFCLNSEKHVIGLVIDLRVISQKENRYPALALRPRLHTH